MTTSLVRFALRRDMPRWPSMRSFVMPSGAGLALAGLLVFGAGAQTSPSAMARREYQQTPAVLERYGDIPVAMDAPGLAPGRSTFTSHAEMLRHIETIAARAPHMRRGTLGRSQRGHEIPFLVFTAEGLSDPVEIRALDRPIIWLIGQQHGNEPAGGEAMLSLASALADGDLQAVPARITVVIVPRANPDGAIAFTRAAANGLDPNRDHLLLRLPEIRALHAKMGQLPADVVVDAHEYQVAGNWLAKFGGLQQTDAMLFYATHPSVPTLLVQYAAAHFIPAIAAAFKPVGLEWSWYHTPTTHDPADRGVSLGGNAPGIARNTFGLNGSLSFLVETRGIGVGRQGYQRRVATHYLAAKAVLEEVAQDPERVRRTVADAREAIAGSQEPIIVGYKAETARMSIKLLQPQTAAERSFELEIVDTRTVRWTQTRPRPAGYLVQPEARDAVDALRIRGVTVCPIEARPTELEAFLVEPETGPVNRESIDPDQAVKVKIERRMVTPSAGAVFVPMRQAAAAVVSASLEPDSPGSHVGVGLVPVSPSGEAPIYRVPVGADVRVDRTCGG